MSILDEVQTETWHILVSIYSYQRLIEALSSSPTRYDFANNLVGINSLAEMIVIRTARLVDTRKDARSISMVLKRCSFGINNEAVTTAADNFRSKADPVVKIRHEKIAHMKPGTLSHYPVKPLASELISAIEALLDFLDTARGKEVSYNYKVGSKEAIIDLRESLKCGYTVYS
ncbi:hypothetical protein [Marinomonas foliarum]|uniref:HEPN AbiU2-like domain-containing protein n=1 Tax=Marinomonas foliarum TaxID=491950 RepID=A0ABX7INC2_9GAMM|nr:hypothetical protein [Marinomonas foliarum]QRV23825.1 hypothetical protein JSY38_17710 [Marinomonas foliarum]